MLQQLLRQLHQLLLDPAAAAPGAASTTAGTSSLQASAALALGHASLTLAASRTYGVPKLLLAALPEAASTAAEAAKLLTGKDAKVAKRAAAALGYLCWAHAGAPPEAVASAVANGGAPAAEASTGTAASAASPAASGSLLEAGISALLALQTSKNEEVLFAAGEALCFCFGGVPVTPDDILHGCYAGLAAWKQQQEQLQQAPTLPASQAMELEGGASAAVAPDNGADPSPALAAAQQQILAAVLDECLLHSRVEVRCAGAVWLVSLLLYCGRHPRLLPMLPDIQQALSALLGDQNELTQVRLGLCPCFRPCAPSACVAHLACPVRRGAAGDGEPRAGRRVRHGRRGDAQGAARLADGHAQR